MYRLAHELGFFNLENAEMRPTSTEQRVGFKKQENAKNLETNEPKVALFSALFPFVFALPFLGWAINSFLSDWTFFAIFLVAISIILEISGSVKFVMYKANRSVRLSKGKNKKEKTVPALLIAILSLLCSALLWQSVNFFISWRIFMGLGVGLLFIVLALILSVVCGDFREPITVKPKNNKNKT